MGVAAILCCIFPGGVGEDEAHLTATPSGFRGLGCGYLGHVDLEVTYVFCWL